MEIFYSCDIEGNLVKLDAEQSGHCVKVLRHREGDEVDIIDGKGTLMHCTLLDASPKCAVARMESEEKNFGSHPYRLTLAVCPTKNSDRYEWMAEKVTEIGVDIIAPVIGDRSERKVFKPERVRRIVLSAAKQSLKGAVPEIAEACTVSEFIDAAPKDALKLIAYCFEGEKVSIRQALEKSQNDNVVILIGPEGDFSPKEVAKAVAAGFRQIHLGSSRLRTETAAVTAAEAVYFKYL